MILSELDDKREKFARGRKTRKPDGYVWMKLWRLTADTRYKTCNERYDSVLFISP